MFYSQQHAQRHRSPLTAMDLSRPITRAGHIRFATLAAPVRPSPTFPPVSRNQPNLRRSQSTTAERPYLPRIAQPSLWKSFIPKPLRGESKSKPVKRSNPANYFIWIYIFIGSQAIRILTIKNEAAKHRRIADIKLAQLREVVERLQAGEEVDVEKMLGTGDEQSETEWEQALRELESEERLWQNNRSRRRAERQRREEIDRDADPVNRAVQNPTIAEVLSAQAEAPVAPAFY